VLSQLAFAGSFGTPAFVFLHFMTSLALVGLVLMHSGRDTGMAGMGYVPQSQGGTHIVERNLSRLTIAVGVVFFVNTIILYHLLA
jgi:preprotein translocase subunit SecG